jgi:hypothetical protein
MSDTGTWLVWLPIFTKTQRAGCILNVVISTAQLASPLPPSFDRYADMVVLGVCVGVLEYERYIQNS